jgi:DNA-binding LytR/AlgR family response regulator
MQVLIIEDERPASQKLIRLLGDINLNIQIVDVLKSVEQTINWLLKNTMPDLIFMDIQLEDGICFEIFEKNDLKTPVIFTTAYDEYTLKAFKVNSIDYLLKPIVFEELKNAVEKFSTLHGQKTGYQKFETIIQQIQPKTKERFLIKIGEHYRSVPTSGIHCFYIRERCNFILTDTGKNYPVDYSLDKIEKMLDSRFFFRINRNLIINFSAIQDIIAYSSNRLKIIIANRTENDEILVSRERVSEFKEWMDR